MLGASSIIISGSANFSNNSISSNDENTLIIRIRDNKRATDIYFGEFMRIFRHFYFCAVQADVETATDPNRILLNKTDSWEGKFYTEGTCQFAERIYFDSLVI